MSERLDEISLITFSRRPIASDQIVKFSKERQGFQGQAPKSTKFISLDINREKDYVTFHLLTEATEKYEDDHEYHALVFGGQGRMERDPSATYDIELRFFGVSKIISMSPRKVDAVKNWLWSTDFQVWSSAPSFWWQGFAYNLSRIGASMEICDIPPTKKHINPKTGRTVMGWHDVHGNALVDKHLFDLFLHIRFFINIMAGAVMNKLNPNPRKRPPRPNKYNTPTPAPIQPPAPAAVEAPVEPEAPEDFEPEPEAPEMEEPNDETTGEDGGINADITKPKEESMKPYNWKTTAFGKEAQFKLREKLYRVLYEESGILAQTVMDFDEGSGEFRFEPLKPLEWRQRVELYSRAAGLTETSLSFNYGLHREPVRTAVLATLVGSLRETIRGNRAQVISISTSPMVSESHARLAARLVEEILDFYPSKTAVLFDNYSSGVLRYFIMEKALRNSLFPETLTEAEGKAVVVAYGTFSPPTRNHLRLLQKVIASAEQTGAANLVFIQPDRDFAGDAGSLKVKQSVLRRIPQLRQLNICADPQVHSLYDAMMYLYTDLHYKTVSIICGADQVQEFEAFLHDNNGRKTAQGYFKFDEYKVVSFGATNPDKDEEAQQARNALTDGDLAKFIRSSEMPYFGQMKNLFNILRYELKGALGMSGV